MPGHTNEEFHESGAMEVSSGVTENLRTPGTKRLQGPLSIICHHMDWESASMETKQSWSGDYFIFTLVKYAAPCLTSPNTCAGGAKCAQLIPVLFLVKSFCHKNQKFISGKVTHTYHSITLSNKYI